MDNSSAIVEFTRIYLAVFYSFVAAFYAIRITAKKRTGLHEVVFPGAYLSSTWWNHVVFRVFRFTIWMVCLFRLFFPVVDNYLGIVVDLNVLPVVLTGNIVLTAGFLLTIMVHFDLGHQWRSGIDPGGPEKLRTDGLYKYSRNPMFLGIATAQAGFFLALPSIFSGVCLLVGWYILHRQTIAEEAHLLNRFPKDYSQYMGRVRRWL